MMQLIHLSPGMTILSDIAVWLLLHFLIGWVAWRLPVSFFSKERWLYRPRRWERHGRFYRKFLFIDRWKRFMPEAGGFFPGGFSKKRLTRRDQEYLVRFSIETRRGEFTHWLSILPAPLFFLWNDWPVGLCMVAYALLFNLPFIAVNRFNRARLARILMREATRLGGSRPSARGYGTQDDEPSHCLSSIMPTVSRAPGDTPWTIA